MDLQKGIAGLGKSKGSSDSADKKKKVVHLGKHPGFQKAQTSIAAKEGVSEKSAGAILASASRGASNAAKSANPNLKKVK